MVPPIHEVKAIHAFSQEASDKDSMGNCCAKPINKNSPSNSFTNLKIVNGKVAGSRKSNITKIKHEIGKESGVVPSVKSVATGNSLYNSLYNERSSPYLGNKAIRKEPNHVNNPVINNEYNVGERSNSYKLKQEDVSGTRSVGGSREGSFNSKHSLDMTASPELRGSAQNTLSQRLIRGHKRTGSNKSDSIKLGHTRTGSNASTDMSRDRSDSQKRTNVHVDFIRKGTLTIEPKIQRNDSGKSTGSQKGVPLIMTSDRYKQNSANTNDIVITNNQYNSSIVPGEPLTRSGSCKNEENPILRGSSNLRERRKVVSNMEPLDLGLTVDNEEEFSTAQRILPNSSDKENVELQSACVIKWKKGNLLGRGTFGKVYSALTDTGQIVAVKQIQLDTKNWHQAENDYKFIQREVDLLKTLKHPNIVEFLDCGLDMSDHTINILMEHISGGTIASLLKKFGTFDESVFRRYSSQLIDALTYLHSNNVVHRDIKGSNIMVNTTGLIKLIDFGTAKRTTEDLVTPLSAMKLDFSIKGTPYWMAPEVVQMTAEPTCKADIWSVGCTIIEMATGSPPYFHMQPMSALFAIGSIDKPSPKLSDKFSAEAVDFVSLCLIKNMHKRPTALELGKHPFMLQEFIHSYPDNRTFYI